MTSSSNDGSSPRATTTAARSAGDAARAHDVTSESDVPGGLTSQRHAKDALKAFQTRWNFHRVVVTSLEPFARSSSHFAFWALRRMASSPRPPSRHAWLPSHVYAHPTNPGCDVVRVPTAPLPPSAIYRSCIYGLHELQSVLCYPRDGDSPGGWVGVAASLVRC